jgi:hypothetical protein
MHFSVLNNQIWIVRMGLSLFLAILKLVKCSFCLGNVSLTGMLPRECRDTAL